MDENSLIINARAGDDSAFSSLIQQYSGMVLALACYYVGYTDGPDAAQEIWLAVYRKLWQLEVPESFVPWLKKLAFYQCLNYRKARARRNYEVQLPYQDWQILSQVVADQELSFEDALERKESRVAVSRQLDLLPAEYGLILRLYYFRELSIRQISELTQLPPSTVKGRLYQGRQLLKSRLASRIKGKGNWYD